MEGRGAERYFILDAVLTLQVLLCVSRTREVDEKISVSLNKINKNANPSISASRVPL